MRARGYVVYWQPVDMFGIGSSRGTGQLVSVLSVVEVNSSRIVTNGIYKDHE